MERSLQLRSHIFSRNQIDKRSSPVKKSLAALNRCFAPRRRRTIITHEKNVRTKCICTIFIYNVIRIYNVSERFGHFCSVFSQNHPLQQNALRTAQLLEPPQYHKENDAKTLSISDVL